MLGMYKLSSCFKVQQSDQADEDRTMTLQQLAVLAFKSAGEGR